MSEQTTVPLTATVTSVQVSATLAEPGPQTETCTGRWIVPVVVEWRALRGDGGVTRTVTVYAASSNNRTWFYDYDADPVPSWVPQPPAGWDAALGVSR